VLRFAAVENRDEEDVDPRELWNCIYNIFTDCPHHSSEELGINTTDINNVENPDKIKLLQEHDDSPIAGYSG
jgi:hypothetical protein